jgi:hypothetical protein
LRTCLVKNLLLAMLAAVQLHNQGGIGAPEIDNGSIDFVLATEFPTLQATILESVPEQLFGVGLMASQAVSPVCVKTLRP